MDHRVRGGKFISAFLFANFRRFPMPVFAFRESCLLFLFTSGALFTVCSPACSSVLPPSCFPVLPFCTPLLPSASPFRFSLPHLLSTSPFRLCFPPLPSPPLCTGNRKRHRMRVCSAAGSQPAPPPSARLFSATEGSGVVYSVVTPASGSFAAEEGEAA